MPGLARLRVKRSQATDLTACPASILHVDMDAFFVSVELLDRPELRGKPVVVGGRPDQRGVVSAASYEARRYGIHSATPLRAAARLCPHAIFLEPRHTLYAQWSDRIAEILARYSPVVEMVSIDEAYLDLTGSERLLGPPLAAAHRLRGEIWDTTGLPCSMGLAATRLVAKVASDQAKPRGLLWVPAGREQRFLAPLPVGKIPGIGRVTAAALERMGIRTVGELAAVPPDQLEEHFGRWGEGLARKARGQDAWDFVVDAEPKSIGHNQTFGADTDDEALLRATLSRLLEKAAKRLRDAGLYARTVTVTIRYAGFETHTRARTLAEPTDLDSVLGRAARELFERHRDHRRKIRLLGVALSRFAAAPGQLSLLDGRERERRERLARAADRLRDRFGEGKLRLGGSITRSPKADP